MRCGPPAHPKFVDVIRSSASVDAEVFGDGGVVEDVGGLEGLLVDEDGDECVPDGLRRPRQGFGWSGEWRVPGQEEERFFFVDSVTDSFVRVE